jgi:alcohol dehydrogenase
MDIRAMKLRMLKRVMTPPEVCVGKGSVERVGCLEPARVLVVASGSAQRSGAVDRVIGLLKDAAVRELLPLATGEPSVSVIEAARATVESVAPEWIVAIGGGSVLDAAKFLWAQYEYPELRFSGASPIAIGPLRRKARMMAIPTTAGSGSEASQAAVLAAADGTKVAYVSSAWLPDVVVLDPELTVNLPRELTIATGFDALTHAVESSVSSLSNSFLQVLAGAAIELILRNLPLAAELPHNLSAREGMLEAAFWAGLCQSTASTGAAHALSHATSKLHGSLHGMSTGFYLLPTMRWNRNKNAAVYDQLAVASGFPDGAAMSVALATLATQVGLPQKFEELLGRTPDESERAKLAEASARDGCIRTNACRLTTPELTQLLMEIG